MHAPTAMLYYWNIIQFHNEQHHRELMLMPLLFTSYENYLRSSKMFQVSLNWIEKFGCLKPTKNGQFMFYEAVNSLTAKSVPAGTKLTLFGRYVLNIYVGIVRYILRKTKTWRVKIYLPTQRTNWRISYDIN